jgi:hypothetical protein
MLRSIKSPQRAPRALHAVVQSDGTVDVGSKDLSVALAASVYTITPVQAFARVPVVCVTPTEPGVLVLTSVTASAVEVSAFAVDGTTATDKGFHIQILGFDAADEY